jgi:hypothetical protein
MKKAVMFTLILGLGFAAQALTLKERKKMKDWQDYLNDKEGYSYVKTVKEKCGFDIPVTINGNPTPFMDVHAGAYCDAPRSQISGMCTDETYKAAIKASVAKITCVLGNKEKEVKFQLKNKELTFTVGVNASNLEQKTKEFLENNL